MPRNQLKTVVCDLPVQTNLSRATDLEARTTVCNDDNRILVETLIPRGLDSSHLLRRLAWLCDGGKKFITIDKKDHASFFRSIAFAVPSLVNEMKPLGTLSIPGRLSETCGTCSPKFPVIHWVRETDAGVLTPFSKPNDVGRYEDGLRKQAPALRIMVNVPPNRMEAEKDGSPYVSEEAKTKTEVNEKKQRISLRLIFNPSRIAHRAQSLLPAVEGTLAGTASKIKLKAFTEPGHSDSLVFNLKPFSESISTLAITHGISQNQPPNFPPGLRLDQKQLATVKYMVDREDKPQAFIEREDEEEVIDGLPLRVVGRAERMVHCAGGIIADKVGAGKTVMTLALIDLQWDKNKSAYMDRDAAESRMGAKALKATLIIVPEHIIDQWEKEVWRFLPTFRDHDVIVLRSSKDLFSAENRQRILNAKIVLANDSLFGENSYREELAKHSARNAINASARSDTSKAPYSERAYVEWHRACVRNLRVFLSRYLKRPLGDGLRMALVRDMKTAYDAHQYANQDLVDTMVKQSSRRGIQSQNTKKAAPMTKKSLNLKPAQMFYDACILFEYYSWTRIVWDEISYKNVAVAQFLATATTSHKWLLSGTPPRQNLADVSYMAGALGISLCRPIDLRLGLPSITTGPTLSVRTEAETCLSFGRLKSDKFVKDRHQQAEYFLKTFTISNDAAPLKIKMEERVVVCAPTQAEKAIYLEKQQTWRRVEMNQDNLDKNNLVEILRAVGISPGATIPDDLSSRALSYAASLPFFGTTPIDSTSILAMRHKILNHCQDYIGRLFVLLLWLARRLELDSTPAREKGKNLAAVTEPLIRILRELQNGNVGYFGGYNKAAHVYQALTRSYDSKDIRNWMGQSVDNSGDSAKPKFFGVDVSLGDHKDIIRKLYETQREDWSWAHFYKIGPEHLDKISQADLKDLFSEHMHFYSEPGEEIDKKVSAATAAELRHWMELLLPSIKEDIHDYLRGLLPDENIPRSDLHRKTIPSLEVEARVRGLKYVRPAKKADVIRLIRAHDEGGAGWKNYENSTNIRSLMPFGPPPMLGALLRVRGANVSETENAFKEAMNLFTNALQILGGYVDQELRAAVFDDIIHNPESDHLECRMCLSMGQISGEPLVVNLICGHVYCRKCIRGHEVCTTDRCPAAVKNNLVDVAKLYTERRDLPPTEEESDFIGEYSSKVKCVIELIQRVPKDEQVVVFTQYMDLMRELLNAMEANSITAKTTTNLGRGTIKSRAGETIEEFKSGMFRVLVLKVDAPEAAGSNLIVANHVIFATPLATKSQDTYDSCMEQAKGRCARRGQTKDVTFYHCVVEGTVEVDMLEARTNKIVRVPPGQCMGKLVPNDGCCMLGTCRGKECEKTRAHSLLTQTEIWKALGETDRATITAHGNTPAVKDAATSLVDETQW